MFSRARRLLIALVLACSGVVLTQLPAHACKCVNTSTKADVKRADAVFSGVLLDSSTGPTGRRDRDRTTYEIEAETVYKGDITMVDIEVVSSLTSCGLGNLDSNRRYVFFVAEKGSRLTADQCGGTARASTSLTDRVERLLGEGRDLSAPVEPPEEKAVFTKVADAEPETLTRLAAPGAALVLAGLLGLFVVRRAGRRSS